ncbi:hypothetical protein BDN72DRAFT_874597 [Pluteus cervinus]|uniref:Uncharacterized protein n=1 Tax=Pluteus cervinus TaxID=181527 RepID=A0ACD3BAM9_9AGAR|nr:hypothetical protein BDN72DRAFT_874597 [Pluteus cervinus]
MPPKKSKKSTTKISHRTKPLTDYFQLKPAGPDSTNNTISNPSARLGHSPTRLQLPPSTLALCSQQTARLSPIPVDIQDAITLLPKSPRLAVAQTPDPTQPVQMAPFSSPVSLHGGKGVSKSSISSKRKSKPDSDTEMDPLDVLGAHSATQAPPSSLPTTIPLSSRENLMWNASQRKTSRYKKARLSPPLTASASEKGELVPTSHSSEREELLHPVPQRDVRSVIEHVDTWRKLASLPSPSSPKSTPDMQTIEVDIILPEAPDVSENPHTPVASSCPSTPILPFALTPPLTSSPDLLPRVPTPVTLDAASKAAQIIADIKARVYASAPSSPEPERPEFNEELDDDSDDELPSTFYNVKGKAPMTYPVDDAWNPMGPDCTMSSPVSSPVSSRASSPKRRRVQRSRAIPQRAPVVLTASTITASRRPKKIFSANPLDALLKEKRKADQLGRGESAFRRAESTLIDQTDDDMRWSDEELALATVEERKRVDDFLYSGLPEAEDISLDAQDRNRLLGDERSVAVGALLEHDKFVDDEDLLDGDLGVPLWLRDSADLMDVDSVSAVTDVPRDGHPIFQLLVDSVNRHAYDQAKTILDSGLLATLSVSQALVDILSTLALQPDQPALSTAAFCSLSELWSLHPSSAHGLDLHFLVTNLVSLGANPQVLLGHGVQVSHGPPRISDQRSRSDVLLNLAKLFTLSAKKYPLPLDDVPTTLILLLLVALDPSSSNELRVAIIAAITTICESFAPEGASMPSVESKFCSSVLAYCRHLHSKNQALLISFLTSGGNTPRRIASWIANSLLVERLEVQPAEYSRVPPLEGLRDILSSTTPGAFELNESTNYITMGYHVKLLAAAISDVEGYLELERENAVTKSPSTEKISQLSRITAAIDLLHDQIADTRAAHLDRSRTKAAMKAVGRRIYYQSMFVSRSRGRSKATLKDYFG